MRLYLYSSTQYPRSETKSERASDHNFHESWPYIDCIVCMEYIDFIWKKIHGAAIYLSISLFCLLYLFALLSVSTVCIVLCCFVLFWIDIYIVGIRYILNAIWINTNYIMS